MLTVRPATAQDSAAWPEVQQDRWRPDGNRRSFVAELGGQLVGHCRGIDNVYHPTSRVLVLEVKPAFRRQGIGAALLEAQTQVSTWPLRAKISSDMPAAWALARTFGGVLQQACPPWQHIVDPQLRSWAQAHSAGLEHLVVRPVRESDLPQLLVLAAVHYIAQHASWSPAASREVLINLFTDDFTTSQLDMRLSRIAVENGEIVGAACVWWENPAGLQPADSAPVELSLIIDRHGDPARIPVLASCLAGVINASDDGVVYGIDSHLTETVEYNFMQSLPSVVDPAAWLALVAIPVPGLTPGTSVPKNLIPDAAAWLRSL